METVWHKMCRCVHDACFHFVIGTCVLRRRQTLRPRRGWTDFEEFATTQTKSHLSGSDRSLCYRPLHGVPQRTGCHCTRALHLIIHSYGRVIVSQ